MNLYSFQTLRSVELSHIYMLCLLYEATTNES